MAYRFSLVRASDGRSRSGYYGFSWTTLLLGPLTPITRKDFSRPVLIMTLEAAACVAAFFLYDRDANLLVGRVLIVFGSWALVHNELHALGLMSLGFRLDGPDEVVAALNPKFPESGRTDRIRLLNERCLLLVLAGISALQLLVIYVPALVSVKPPAVVQENRPPAPSAPGSSSNVGRQPVEEKRADVVPDKVTVPAPVAPPAVPARSSAEILLERQRQCDNLMGTQFDPDLPKDVSPVVNTSIMTESSIDEAIINCQAASRGGDRRFGSQLGRAYAAKAVLLATGGNESQAKENMERARKQWEAARAQGSSAAMNFLGALYNGSFNSANVVFIQPDNKKALEFWMAGANLGNPKAARNAGSVLLLGSPDYYPVEQDIKAAIRLLEKGIRGGDPTAAGVLGRALYLNDPKGVGKDVVRGLSLLETACAARDQVAREFYDSQISKQKLTSRPPGC
jgi:hypothetical protein